MQGIDSRRLMYTEVVEVRSNCRKSYFWWFGNPTCDDSTRSNRIEKDKVVDLFEGRGKKGQCDLMCGAPLDDWANAGLC